MTKEAVASVAADGGRWIEAKKMSFVTLEPPPGADALDIAALADKVRELARASGRPYTTEAAS